MSRTKTRVQSRKQPAEKPSSQSNPFLRGNNLNAVLALVLAGMTIAVYSPVLRNSFVAFDDKDYVTENPHVRDGLSWSTIKWAFTTFTAANWHPLTWLSHALDYQLFALNPFGHHLDSVLIHALNVVILFFLLARVTKRVWPSVAVAALFAVHPLNVESVAWIAERKNVLSTLFFFLAIGAYVRYARRPDWRRYLLMVALFAAGLMAKPMVITLPFVLLLLDYWPLERTASGKAEIAPSTSNSVHRFPFSTLLLEKVPLLLLSAASAWITLRAQRAGHAIGSIHQFPITIRTENAIVSYGIYLRKMLWPARLAVLYPHPTAVLPAWQWIPSALVLISITTFVVVFRSKRYLTFGWLWFLGTLVPVIGLIQVGIAARADRYAYIPLIGIFVMIAWGFDDWLRAKRLSPVWLIIPAVCVFVPLCFAAERQSRYWENKYTLWAHALSVTEQNSFAHEAMGTALEDPTFAMTANRLDGLDTEQKRLDAARRHYQAALNIQRQLAEQNPDDYMELLPVTLNQLGILDVKQNRLDEGRQYYEEALRYYHELARQKPHAYLPDVAMTLNNLVNVDRLQNRLDDAREHCEDALTIYRQLEKQNESGYLPETAAMLDKLGIVDRLQNRVDDARKHYSEAVKIRRQLAERNPDANLPALAVTLGNFGLVDATQNRSDDARKHYEEALKIQSQVEDQNLALDLPNMAMTLSNLATLDREQNRTDEARQHYQAALRIYRQIAPQNPVAYLPEMITALNNLANLYLRQNQIDNARECYEVELKAYRQLAQQDPGRYLPYLAGTLSYAGFLDRSENRIEESRAYYQESLGIFRKLSQENGKYTGEVARAEASLRELDMKGKSPRRDQ